MNRNWWMDPRRLPKYFCNRAVVHCLLLGSSTPEKQSFSLWLMPHSRILQDHNPQVPHLFHLLPLWISQSSLHIKPTWLFLRLNISLQRYTIISSLETFLSSSFSSESPPISPYPLLLGVSQFAQETFPRPIYHLQTLFPDSFITCKPFYSENCPE